MSRWTNIELRLRTAISTFTFIFFASLLIQSADMEVGADMKHDADADAGENREIERDR